MVSQKKEQVFPDGSQQCLDLIGKVLIGTGDHVVIERPGYLGAIQAFSLYEPVFHPVAFNDDGPDTAALEAACRSWPFRLFYSVSNSQRPGSPIPAGSGRTWQKSLWSMAPCLLRMTHTGN